MFAVIKVGGNQYRVNPGETVVVDRLSGEIGSTVSYPALLIADGDQVHLGAEAGKTAITAKILSHEKGEKIHIRRFRSKSRHRRHIGFRALTTTLAIESIGTSKVTQTQKAAETSTKPEKKPLSKS